jgi:hypothetical protein
MLQRLLQPAYWAPFGAVMGFALGGSLVWSSQQSHSASNQQGDKHHQAAGFWPWDASTTANIVMAVFTGLLFVVAFIQIRQTKILQRAYIAVKPTAVRPFVNGPYYSAEVILENAGNLPAQNVRWFIDREFSDDNVLKNFPIKEQAFAGKGNVLPPKGEMRINGKAIDAASFFAARERPQINYLYIWGEVRYDDGFKADRVTKFCFRYHRDAAEPIQGGFVIKQKSARFHMYGNEAD